MFGDMLCVIVPRGLVEGLCDSDGEEVIENVVEDVNVWDGVADTDTVTHNVGVCERVDDSQ